MSRFLSGPVLLMKDRVKTRIDHARASGKKRSYIVVEILRNEEDELHDNLCGQTVLADRLLDIGRATPSREVLMVPWVDAAPSGDSSDVAASDEVQAAWSSRVKKISTPLKRSTNRRKTFTMWTLSDAAKGFSDDMPVIDLESHLQCFR